MVGVEIQYVEVDVVEVEVEQFPRPDGLQVGHLRVGEHGCLHPRVNLGDEDELQATAVAENVQDLARSDIRIPSEREHASDIGSRSEERRTDLHDSQNT